MRTFIIFLVILLLAAIPAGASDTSRYENHYSYDDGSSENSIGLNQGDMVWLQYFDPIGGTERITHVSTTFGLGGYPSSAPPLGTYAHVYVWDDPNNDGDPTDAVLLGQGGGYMRDPATDVFTHYPLEHPVTVFSRFFVGVSVEYTETCWPAPLDESVASLGRAWQCGDYFGNFDPDDLTAGTFPPAENDANGQPGVWLLRAHHFMPAVDCESFDYSSDTTTVRGWNEFVGDWEVVDKRLQSEDSATQQWIHLDSIIQGDGCVEGQAFYGSGVGIRYMGVTVRRITTSFYILVKLQDNSGAGYFDSFFIYDGATAVASIQNQNFGTDPEFQVEYVGTTVTLRIDADHDGTWENQYNGTVSITGAGLTGASAYNQCALDDWRCGPSPEAWGGTILDFDGVPQTYWYFDGNQNLADYYDGLSFGSAAVVLEESVYGYNNTNFPWHSFDAILTSVASDVIRIDFDLPTDHVGFWYTSADGDTFVEAYDSGDNLLLSTVAFECIGRNDYLALDAEGIAYVILDGDPGYFSIDDFEYRPGQAPPETVNAIFQCSPAAGTVPFSVLMRATLQNTYTGFSRRIAARLDADLGGGTHISNWKSGWGNVDAGGSMVRAWNQNFPALGSVIGLNVFTLTAEDVTPVPYNQAPYPASGDTASDSCTVTATAP